MLDLENVKQVGGRMREMTTAAKTLGELVPLSISGAHRMCTAKCS